MSDMLNDNTVIRSIYDEIVEFIKGFRDANGVYKYREQIETLKIKDSKSITVDHNDLALYNQDVITRLAEEPSAVLKEFSNAVYDVLKEVDAKYADSIKDEIIVRISNYPYQVKMRDIDADLIGRLISTAGMVVRASEVKPFISRYYYRCVNEHDGYISRIDYQRWKRKGSSGSNSNKKGEEGEDRDERRGGALTCKKCGAEISVDIEKSKFSNIQMIRLQELPEDLPPGQLPYHIDVMLIHDLVDNARPGDRIILTGIVDVEKDLESSRMDVPLFRIRIEGNNIEFLASRDGVKDASARSDGRFIISDDDEREIKRIASRPDVYDLLISSFAPHIYGHEIIKEAILLQIVGSPQRELEDATKLRGDINILLVGDPGTAKSELLKYAARIAPRGLYTSGRGSTAAGLTAAVIRDKSGMMMLEAGAVVLGDQGLVCIDELDKMRAEDRSALHEVMEQQTCSVAKGGIVATLNARTSILAAANPILGKYDPYRNITENVNLPIPLLTRFDLIFAIRDEPSKEGDANLARHILGIHRRIGYEHLPPIPIDLLRKYLAYAKRFNPLLSKEAEDRIFEYYMQMRANASPDAITITARQLEALIRLATARARLMLRNTVTVEDAERAIYIFNVMLNKVGIDVKTGKVDLGVLHGMPSSERSKMQLFLDVFNALSGKDQNPVEEQALVTELAKTGKFTEDEAREWIRKANAQGIIYEVRQGFYKRA
ncbi:MULTISPECIES: minichromosome maintenance protein MCM [Candidatus Nitrosocaldus]|jgi:replicative DNA helicase Mcm|uniref:DNA helicase n=1 Tax=Candidatus Nitrosocaldus cavascurensis TaxID=2058097 RepID=A0A2K5AQZ5_9ARCH|nr:MULTISPECIES: minichromosome maintenance protein MCM [Candidatus Nitrosocaldus]SPC34047.1 minichromosome maintenance complex protein [Candidatus Nitrosocaldus cavascurensis]